jgi:hypothetical protein
MKGFEKDPAMGFWLHTDEKIMQPMQQTIVTRHQVVEVRIGDLITAVAHGVTYFCDRMTGRAG